MKYTTIALPPETANRVKMQLSKINQSRLEAGLKPITLSFYATTLLFRAMESEEISQNPTTN